MRTIEHFVPPRSGTLTDAAFAELQQFNKIVGPNWIAGFTHFSQSKMKPTKDSEWIDLGSGIGLGGYARSDIHKAYIHVRGGIEFVIQIPSTIWKPAANHIIDVDPNNRTNFILR